MINFNSDFNRIYEELNVINDIEPGNSNIVTEAVNISASNQFWAYANKNKISTFWFHLAFDEELRELKLMDIFDEDGMLKRGVWTTRIQPAKVANPESRTIKALCRMYWLQFKEGVTKSIEQLRKEKEDEESARKQAERKAKEEQDRLDREAKYAAAKEEWEILNEKLPHIQTLITDAAEKFAEEKKVILQPDLEEAIRITHEIETITRGLIRSYNDSPDRALARLKSAPKAAKVVATLEPLDERWPNPRIFIKVEEFLGEPAGYHSFRVSNKEVFNYTSFTVDNIEDETVKSELLALLNKIWNIVNDKYNVLDIRQRQYNELLTKINTAKAAQAAVDTGSHADSSFISSITAMFDDGRKAAQKEADMWADSTSDNQGAAYAFKTYETIRDIGIYLVNCNWRATIDGVEIASWRKEESTDDLLSALDDVFKAYKPSLVIELVK